MDFRACVEVGSLLPVPPEVQEFLWRHFFHHNCIVITTWTWLAEWKNEWMKELSTLMVESKLLQSKGLFQTISFASVKESFWSKLETVLSSFWLPLDSTVLVFRINTSQSISRVCHFQRSSSGLRLYVSGQLCVKLVVSVVSGRLK